MNDMSISQKNTIDSFDQPSKEDIAAFKEEWVVFLKGITNQEGGRTGQVLKHLYSQVSPTTGTSDDTESGADKWERVTTLSRDYYIPTEEAALVDSSRPFLRQLFAERPTVIELGPGSYQAITTKSIPTIKAVNASQYIAIDINENFCVRAANLAKDAMPDIKIGHVHGDFTKPFTLPPISSSSVLITMWGCTLTQFPFSASDNTGEATLEQMLTNIGQMVNYNAAFLATLDENLFPQRAKECYQGEMMGEFLRHLWTTSKTMIELSGDKDENYVVVDGSRELSPADAVVYDPRYENGRIIHSYVTKKDMLFVLDGIPHRIPRGTIADAGPSERWTVPAVKSKIKRISNRSNGASWTYANCLTSPGTIRAPLLIGSNSAPALWARARGETTKTPVEDTSTNKLGTASGIIARVRRPPAGRPVFA